MDNAITDVIFRLSPDKVEAVGLIRWAGQRVGIAAITQYKKSAFWKKSANETAILGRDRREYRIWLRELKKCFFTSCQLHLKEE